LAKKVIVKLYIGDMDR